MNAAERDHILQLLQIHRAHLHELELQAAKYGIAAPTHITIQISEYKQTISGLENQLRDTLPRHNLPSRDYEQFIGRQKELDELQQMLQPYPKSRHHLVTIDGIGGAGKSTLALETAYLYCEKYYELPEADRFEAIVWLSAKQLHLTADGILKQRQHFNSLKDLYEVISHVFEMPEIIRSHVQDQGKIVEKILGERRTLLIIDNLETVDDEELLMFLRMLPDPTKAIVTTRHRIDVAYPLRLRGLSDADALTLIQQEAARKHVVVPSEAQEKLFQKTGGIPLAIVWSIGLVGLGKSIESTLRQLSQGQNDISKFCFEAAVAQIQDQDAYNLLLALAIFEESVNRDFAGIVVGLSDDHIRRDDGLSELIRLSLANKDGDRFSLLPLTRTFALNILSKRMDLERVLRQRWINLLIEISIPYSQPHWKGRNRELMRQEGQHFVAMAHWCQENSRIDILLKILPALAFYYDMIGNWNERIRIGKFSLEYANLSGDLKSAIYIQIHVLGWVLCQQNLYEEAKYYIEDAIKISSQLGDVAWQCEALLMYAQALRGQKEFNLAREYCVRAAEFVAILDEEQKLHMQADIEIELGKIARDSSNWQEALKHFMSARNVFTPDNEDSQPVFNLERAWGININLGLTYYELGDLNAAADLYTESLKFAREIGSKGTMTGLLVRLATLEEQRGNLQMAFSYASEALDWSKYLGMKKEQQQAGAICARLAP
jgi:LuxR family glucitol operon transcriptional activator